MFINISGISRLRGVIMYELQSTLAAYARRKFSSGEISVDHLKNILKVSIILDILKLYLRTCFNQGLTMINFSIF